MVNFRKCKLILLFFLSFVIITVILNANYNLYVISDSNNKLIAKDSKTIPNIVHYIVFNQYRFSFEAYLSVLSVVRFQKPDTILIHTNHIYFNGTYWDRIKSLNSTNNTNIKVNYLAEPTHVFGQKLSSVYHASDVARILVLQQWGGIYLDSDVLVLKNLDVFRNYEMVVGWPENEFMGTQILLSAQNSVFLKLWLEGYRRYKPSNWYYNAGHYPTEQILEKMPHLAHRIKKLFGVQNLLDFLYKTHDLEKWKEFYAIHLLSRHPPAPKYLQESLLDKNDNTFGEISRYILNGN